MNASGISGIIHTKNEERFIAQAIRSLQPAVDEVIVADMASTDRTRVIAQQLGARVIDVPDFGYVEPALSLSHAEARHEWILRLDADELIPPRLADELRVLAFAGDEFDVVSICRLNYFFGTPIRSAGWAHDRQLRMHRSSMVTLEDVGVHSAFLDLSTARVRELEESPDLSIVHFNYTDWRLFVDKMNRYTDVHAVENVASGWQPSHRRLFREICRQVGGGLGIADSWMGTEG